MAEANTAKADSTERFGRCPYYTTQQLVQGKWAILIMHYLQDGPVRFNELTRLMPKMTHATLSKQLKQLMEEGLVERTVVSDMPPVVKYSLTPIGSKFVPVLRSIRDFGQEYIAYLQDEAQAKGSAAESSAEDAAADAPRNAIPQDDASPAA